MTDPTHASTPADPLDAIEGGLHVAVVIPAYRVEERIEEVLRTLPPWMRSAIVVDDRSPDRMAERVERIRDPRVRLVRHERNLGVGGAVVTGFREALRLGADVIVKMDGDGQMDPAYLPELLAPLLHHDADFAKGNRYRTLRTLEGMPFVRRLGNAALTFLVKLASGHWKMFDPTNGYFAVRAELLRRMDLDRLPQGFFFECGLLIELGLERAKVEDVPIPARYRGERSSLSVGSALIGFPARLFAGCARRVIRQYFLYDFSAASLFLAIGIPLLGFGVGFGAFQWYRSAVTGVTASTGTVMLAALPVILGFQLLLQALVLDVASAPEEPVCPPLRPTPSAPRESNPPAQGPGGAMR